MIREAFLQDGEYMEDNMKASNPGLVGESSSSTKDLEPPTLEEVTQTIKRLKNHRSPGSENISNGLIKEGQDLICKMHKVMKEIWNAERLGRRNHVSYL